MAVRRTKKKYAKKRTSKKTAKKKTARRKAARKPAKRKVARKSMAKPARKTKKAVARARKPTGKSAAKATKHAAPLSRPIAQPKPVYSCALCGVEVTISNEGLGISRLICCGRPMTRRR